MQIDIDRGQLLSVRMSMYGIRNGFPKAVVRAINKTLTGTRTDAVNEVAGELNLAKKRIRKDFRLRRASWGWMEGTLTSTGVPVGLASFLRTRQVKKGVSVQVKKKGQRKILKHAFIARARNATHVFWREYAGEYGRTAGAFKNRYTGTEFPAARLPEKYRHPILRLTGPRIQDILDKPGVMGRIEKKAGDRFATNIGREADYLLSTL